MASHARQGMPSSFAMGAQRSGFSLCFVSSVSLLTAIAGYWVESRGNRDGVNVPVVDPSKLVSLLLIPFAAALEIVLVV